MDGIKENTLPPNDSPNSEYKIRALDENGKSCVIPFGSMVQLPQEDEVRDFLVDTKIVKRRYTSGSWVDVGLEWDI